MYPPDPAIPNLPKFLWILQVKITKFLGDFDDTLFRTKQFVALIIAIN